MSSANTVTLDIPVSLTKKGLTPEELKELLLSKAQGMQDVSEDQVKESIDRVIKHFCPVKTKKGKLDQRRKSTEVYQNRGMLADGGSSVSQQQEDSEGQYGNDLCRGYHIDQASLFSNFQAQGIQISTDEEGYVNVNGRILNCKELSNLLDHITQTRYVAQLNERASEQPYTMTRCDEEKKKLKKTYDDCKEIVMKRIAQELAIKNDLMKEEEWKNWKKHMELIASFGFMLVLLDSVAAAKLGGPLIED